jgi:hypothetical protein
LTGVTGQETQQDRRHKQWDAQLKPMIDHAPTRGVLRTSPVQPLRARQARAPRTALHAAAASFIILAIMTPQDAGAQSAHPPQPTPRPREAHQAPLADVAAAALTMPTSTQPPPATHSRQEWRRQQRACAQEWSRRKMAGQTTGLLWVDFFEICRKQL